MYYNTIKSSIDRKSIQLHLKPKYAFCPNLRHNHAPNGVV